MPKLLVCTHSSEGLKGSVVHKVYEGPDQLARDHNLNFNEFEPYEGIVGPCWRYTKGGHSIDVHEVDFDGKISHR